MAIDRVKIKNFKSLVDVDLALKNLTIITGVNSSGKSSFIQSLLFFKENYGTIGLLPLLHHENPPVQKKKALFNGNYINIGNAKDLISIGSYGDLMTFCITQDKNMLNLSINEEMEMDIEQASNKDNFNTLLDMMHIFNDSNFHYLSTNRTPPSLMFPFSNDISNNSIGIQGEYATHFLSEYRHKELTIDKLKHLNSKTSQLLENVEKWLGEISYGVSLNPSSDASTQSAKLFYQYTYGKTTSSEYSSLKVGFGLTYVLPVIVLILKAKPNDLLIIENPESHLHPAGQSKIAELCAIACANGVQIIIETHSDHFLNGVRVATKEKLIEPAQSQVYYFKKDNNEMRTKIDEINIDENGKINKWPKGFFDEFDNQLDKLIEW